MGLTEFRMPSLGADMAAGRLVEWLKQPGDRIARGEIIAEVDTDKGAISVEAFVDGTLEKILVQPGEKVPVGTVMALIADGQAAAVAIPATPVAAAGAAPPVTAPPRPAVRISPLARRVAEELGVDPATVTGSGPDGAVTRQDIEAAAAARSPSQPPAAPTTTPAARMRQAIAAAMSRSKREIPHYYLSTAIDFGTAAAWLAEHNRGRPVAARLLPGVLFIKAVAVALRDFPELNAWWEGDHAAPRSQINVGIAIALRQGGLITPAVLETDRLTLDELMQRLDDLVSRAKAGNLRSSELSEGTITVTSLGDRGVDAVHGVIYPPQVAIVGFGRLAERPWVVGGQVVPRPLVTATLAADHRVSDGHRGGLFLAAIEQALQRPEAL